MAKRKPKYVTVKVGDTITVPADSTITVERVGVDSRTARLAIHSAEEAVSTPALTTATETGKM